MKTPKIIESTGHLETALVRFGPSAIEGTGGFARAPISRGTRVIEYKGERISKAESLVRCEASNPFIFNLDGETDLDGSVEWNPARFLNHSCDPNCDAELIENHIWIVANRDIAEGEEITFDYGYDWEDYKDHPCDCGAANCFGFIVSADLRIPKKL